MDPSTGKKAPGLTLEDTRIDVDPNQIDIKLEGGMAAEIAALFTKLFKKEIIGQVIVNTKKQTEVIVDTQINKDLLEYGTQERVPELGTLMFDYSLLDEPVVQNFIAMEFNGTFFDPKNPESYPEGKPSMLPYRDLKGKAFQLFLSDFTINSLGKGIYYPGKDVYVTDILGHYLEMKDFPLTTDLVGKVIP